MIEQMEADNTNVFEQLWGITGELRQKLDARFELHLDASTKNLNSYSSPDLQSQGALNTFWGREIDWLVHSWLRNSQSGFSNMHLTIWLGSQIRVPHLAFAFATIPQLFFYIDYVPRTDLFTDLEYLDRYYEPVNQTYLQLQADSRLEPFISKSVYIRQTLSPINFCYTCAVTDETLNLLRTVAHEMMDRWLTWVDETEPVAEFEQFALSERDLSVRRAIAERDPANQLVARLFGTEMTDTLVRALWGGDRIREIAK